ncbi:hypothetical protein B296_00024255 [Ensete ventricosum]|uniref:Peptidase A2 domain-containing protein n=1 Tax=Ensete ventricosum TaxID=4639 RepID=A0A426ZQV5_ENSVE|nr:hypothetical protein B296_00024255 [Ensete ventricosum]
MSRRLDRLRPSYPKSPPPPLNSTRTKFFSRSRERTTEVAQPSEGPQRAVGLSEISFEAREAEYPDHNDVLVILVCIANVLVKRVMMDTGSSADILYKDAFKKLRLTTADLSPMSSTLTGFIRDSIAPLGTTVLLVTLGQEPQSKTLMVTFMVVGLPTAYNIILRRSTLNRLKAIVSAYHRTIKFPTRAGVGEVRSDPGESRPTT